MSLIFFISYLRNMNIIYNWIIQITYFVLKLIAPFNTKINLFVSGRKESFNKLKALTKNDETIWFHAASLGEFEQGRPILEHLKENYPNYKIVLTFFSPSGYEVRKNYRHADVICYLPFDTKRNMRKFIKMVSPKIAILIKYEFWPNLLNELKREKIKTILVSGIFRASQPFFKPYGKYMRKKLEAFEYFFVQNENSKNLLQSIDIQNVEISGDTRFDRVDDILQQNNALEYIKTFKNNRYTFVAGSTWEEDEALIVSYINNHALPDEKFIIAPHTIHPKRIEELKSSIHKKVVLFSEKENRTLENYQVFIIDTIGILTKIYAYADVSYVGGGLATGLHNILEPATFGAPILFGGLKYEKFKEARDLLALGGATIVTNKKEFYNIFVRVRKNEKFRIKMGKVNSTYITENVGATKKILQYLKNTI